MRPHRLLPTANSSHISAREVICLKIIHCCFGSVFTDGCAYQDNFLSELHHSAGHDVLIVTNRMIYADGVLDIAPAGEFTTASGLRVMRLCGSFSREAPVKDKIRAFPDFKGILEAFAPDIIFFHGLASRELLTAADYRRRHPETSLMADSHAAEYNSATNPLSKYVLHKGLYRSWYMRCRKYIDRLFSIGYFETRYLIELLGAAESDIESLPLGGIMVSREDRAATRARICAEHGFCGDEILFLHSGKLDALKRTRELLAAFSGIPDKRFRLFIAGFVPDDLSPILNSAIAADDRIIYLGWKNSSVLSQYMCAADMYLQPGSTSASLQTALCCGTPALIASHDTYTHLFGDSNAVAYISTQEDIAAVLADISSGSRSLSEMRDAAYSFAKAQLDYREQAERICRIHLQRTGGAE